MAESSSSGEEAEREGQDDADLTARGQVRSLRRW